MRMSSILPPKEVKSLEPMEPRTIRFPKPLLVELEAISKESGYDVPEIVRRFTEFAAKQYREQSKGKKPR